MRAAHFFKQAFFAAILAPGLLLAQQIQFTSIPADMELLPRDSSNTATFTLSGRYLSTGYHQLHSLLLVSGTNQVIENTVVDLDTNGRFSITHHVPARLEEYDLQVFLKYGSSELLVKQVKRLVAGDYFIIAGQSNAMAAADVAYGGIEQNKSYSDRWLRGIGSHQNPEGAGFPCTRLDVSYYQSNCVWVQNGFVGTWGLKLQHDLARRTGVPNCMINGAWAGSSLSQNLPVHEPSSLANIDSCSVYDRLYKKVTQHGLNRYIQLIFWYQGEADAALDVEGTCDYTNKFNTLYNAWKIDYPNVKKVITMQLNTGCTDANLSLLRELQRRIAHQYSDVLIMPSFSLGADKRNSDGCHSTVAGYNELSDRLLPLALKHAYNIQASDSLIMPPEIKYARLLDDKHVCLEFDKPVIVPPPLAYACNEGDTCLVEVKDYFYFEDGNTIQMNLQSIKAEGNKLYLNLADGVPVPKKISYLPDSYTQVKGLYVGPWLLSHANTALPALSFQNIPVTVANNNGWAGAWSNYQSGRIGGYDIHDSDLFYAGDFDGDGAEELLCLPAQNKNGNSMYVLRYSDDQGFTPAQLPGTQTLPRNLYACRHHLIVKDFNGDGRADVFANGNTANGEPATLYSLIGSSWQLLWSDHASPQHPMYAYRQQLVAGNFNGDVKCGLLGYNPAHELQLQEFYYNGYDFVSGDRCTNSILSQFHDKLISADLDGDGASDVLIRSNGNPNQVVLSKQHRSWKVLRMQNNLDMLAESLPLVGNVDNDPQEEMLLLNPFANVAQCKELKQQYNQFWQWRYNYQASLLTSVGDWNFGPGARYYLIKAKANAPKHLLAMRREECTYLASLYRLSDTTGYVPDTLLLLPPPPDMNIIYPNPTNGPLHIQLLAANPANVVTIYDAQGNLLFTTPKQSSKHITLDMSGYQPGMYLLKVDNGASAFIKKVIVQR